MEATTTKGTDMETTVTIKRESTNEANVSQRHIWYDVYLNGKFHSTHNDIFDADDVKTELEAK
jgi:hypothetical protein